MKKTLLALSLLAISASESAQAQSWIEDFNSGIPATWTLYNVDNKTPNSSVAFVTGAWVARIKTDAAGNPIAGDSVATSTSWYSPAGIADDWIVSPKFTVNDPKMVLKWIAKASNSSFPDGYEVRISTTGKQTADFTTVLYTEAEANPKNYEVHGASLSSYNGQDVYVAFRNNSNDKELLFIDDIQALALTNNRDVAIDKVSLPAISNSENVGANGTTVKVTVKNYGAADITALDLNYSVDGGTAVTQTFSGLQIGPFNTYELTFNTKLSGIVPGNHTLTVTAISVNTQPDENPSNNTLAANFVGASKSTSRPCLIEEFSSSTCGPCAVFNATFDPFMSSIGANEEASNVNLIKYQMNWPSPGTDPSYNSHGISRQNFYGVNSIPVHFTNGHDGSTGDQTEINECKSGTAYMDINGTYRVTNDSLQIDVNVTPYVTTSSGSFKVYIAAVEKDYYYYGGTTSQKHYIHIMRMMFPSGNGNPVTGWTDNSTKNYTYAAKFDVGNNKKLDYHFWTHPKNSNLLVFVQSDNNEILQSKIIPAQWPTDVKDFSNGINHTMVYPNPAQDFTTVAFNLNNAEKVQLQVLDAIGRVVYSAASQQMAAGLNEVRIPTASLSTGAYTIKIQSDNAIATERLSVVK